MAKKSKLPVAKADAPVSVKSNPDNERRYRAEDAMRVMERAEEIKKDKGLMGDMKKLAKEKIKTLGKIC